MDSLMIDLISQPHAYIHDLRYSLRKYRILRDRLQISTLNPSSSPRGGREVWGVRRKPNAQSEKPAEGAWLSPYRAQTSHCRGAGLIEYKTLK